MEVRMQLMDSTIRSTDPMAPRRDVTNEQQNSNPTIVPEPNFYQLIGILRRRSGLILTIAAFGTILAGITGLLITPKYTLKSQIVAEPQGATLLSPEAVQEA